MIRWLLIAIRFIAPATGRVMLFMARLIITTVVAFWSGVPAGVNKLVRTWMEQFWARGIPTEYDAILRWIFTGIAYLMIIGGWIGVAYLTVFLLNRLL
jgi:hypothetical protein